MKIAFLCNPAPPRLKKFPALVQAVQKHVPAEREIFLVDRSVPRSLENHIEKILEGNFDRLAVAGGDGTLNRVINTLEGRRALERLTLGVVPLGTCNDFARYLGFRRGRLLKSLSALTKDRTRIIRVARVNNHFFINNAGFGKKNPSSPKRSNIRVIREMVPVDLKAQWSEGSLAGKFFMMLCANAPYFSGGLRFSRKSDPTDGILDFFFVKKMFKLNLALRLFFGRARLPLQLTQVSRGFTKVSAAKLELETKEPISIALDGDFKEDLTDIREATFEIAGACRFVVPR